MPAFRFRLEKVLGLRLRAEKEAARKLGEQLFKRQACLKDLQGMAEQRRELLGRRDDLQSRRISPILLEQNRQQAIVLDKAIQAGQGRLADVDREVQAAQAELVARSRDRKLMEKLKERKRQEYDVEERRRERRESDALPRPAHGMTIAINSRDSDRR